MDLSQVIQALGALTVSTALGIAVLGFIFDWVRSTRREEKSKLEHLAADAVIVGLLTAERDRWKEQAEANEKRADEADDRTTKITEAFRTATELLSRQPGPRS